MSNSARSDKAAHGMLPHTKSQVTCHIALCTNTVDARPVMVSACGNIGVAAALLLFKQLQTAGECCSLCPIALQALAGELPKQVLGVFLVLADHGGVPGPG